MITNAVIQCGCQLRPPPRPLWSWGGADGAGALSFLAFGYVDVVHVGCTRCVTSNTDHYMNIQARITLRVEFIRTLYFIIFISCVNTITSMIHTNAFFRFD